MDFRLYYKDADVMTGSSTKIAGDEQYEKAVVVELPGSKSITNRALIIRALSEADFQLPGVAQCDDTYAITDALRKAEVGGIIDIGASGLAMRLLTAYFASRPNISLTLTGTERMQERPIGPLVKALEQLGAKIGYEKREGYPPLKISGRQLRGGVIGVRGDVSSQFISALMLIAPTLRDGLKIHLLEEVISESYIRMTAEIMRQFGVSVKYNHEIIEIPAQTYLRPIDFSIESDWSAASYFYGLVALSRNSDVRLGGLLEPEKSLQGDACTASIFRGLGVATYFSDKYAELRPHEESTDEVLELNLSSAPDVVPALAVTSCLLNRKFNFTGISSLRIKECDRLAAIVIEMRKLGYFLRCDNSSLLWSGERCEADARPRINTYNDHRMAMAFALAAVKFPEIVIQDAMVVTKSFPGFWNEMRRLGLENEVI